MAVVAITAVAGLLGAGPALGETLNGYHIGNSHTGNALVQYLADSYALNGVTTPGVGYHIDYSQSAYSISQNPNGVGGVDGVKDTYGAWNIALPKFRWDYVAIQSYFEKSGTLEVAGFHALIDSAKSNPNNANTKFYIYEDWPWKSATSTPTYTDQWNVAYANLSQPAVANRQYFTTLSQQLKADYPTTSITIIPVGQVLANLDASLRAGKVAGINSAYDLYSDAPHMNGIGDWVAHMTVVSTVLDRDPATLQWVPDIDACLQPGGVWTPANIAQFKSLAYQVIWQTVNVPILGSDGKRSSK